MGHEAFDLLAAGAALGDLDASEGRTYEAHLAGCPACSDVRAGLAVVTRDLALAVPQVRAPAELRDALMRAIADAHDEPAIRAMPDVAATPPSGPPGGRGEPFTLPLTRSELTARGRETRRLRLVSYASLAAAAVLAIAAGGLGSRVVGLQDELTRLEARASSGAAKLSSQASVISVALAPGHGTATLRAEPATSNASATAVWLPGTSQSFIVADSLPPTPPGMVYQLWVGDATGVQPLGTFSYSGSGSVVVPLGIDLAGKTAAMITLERTGGATSSEPGPQVIFGEL